MLKEKEDDLYWEFTNQIFATRSEISIEEWTKNVRTKGAWIFKPVEIRKKHLMQTGIQEKHHLTDKQINMMKINNN